MGRGEAYLVACCLLRHGGLQGVCIAVDRLEVKQVWRMDEDCAQENALTCMCGSSVEAVAHELVWLGRRFMRR